MKSSTLTLITWARVRRTKIGVAETPIAIMALVRLGPRKAESAIARIRNGQARKASVRREMKASTTPPTKPAARPMGTPRANEIETATTPASSDARVPQTTRESTSRPMSSVPNQCTADGAWRIALQLVSMGSKGAIHGAPSAMTTNAATTTRPKSALGRRASFSQARRHGPVTARGASKAVIARVALMRAGAGWPRSRRGRRAD